MNAVSGTQTFLSLIAEKGFAKAIITWPRFSVTSFLMVSRLAKQGISPRTTIDAGANTGQFSIAASKIWNPKHLYAFEPVPDSFLSLSRVMRHNTHAEIFQIACGDKSGFINININSHSHSSSVLPLGKTHREAFPGANEVSSACVRILTLDEALVGKPLEPPVLLKIDVQGYESKVISGASRILGGVDYVILETSFKQLYEQESVFLEINDQMKALDFTFVRPVDMLKNSKTGEILQMDCLFARKKT